jgi:hypothetical protein
MIQDAERLLGGLKLLVYEALSSSSLRPQDAERLRGVRAQCPARYTSSSLISISATLQSTLMQQAAVPGIARAQQTVLPHRDTRILEAIKSAPIAKELCRSAAPVPS